MHKSTRNEQSQPLHFAPRDTSYALSHPTRFSRTWFGTALLFFFIAALFGLAMRYFFYAETPPAIEYRNILHAHSHVAMLGWGFMLISGALIFLFPHPRRLKKHYTEIFIANTVATVGMSIAFPIQGYAAVSITFSAIHLIAVYYFGILYLKELKGEKSVSARFIRLGIVWYFVSSLGLLALGPISATLGRHSSLYHEAVQWFMHFQLNGWFVYTSLGVLFRYMERSGFAPQLGKAALPLLNLSLFLTFALSITWSHPLDALFYLNSLGVISQTWGFLLIVRPLVRGLNGIHEPRDGIYFFILLGILSVLAKAIIQMVVVVPYVAEISYTIRNYVMAFFHLITLETMTFTIGGVLLKQRILPVNILSKVGWGVLAVGFVSTEVILFGQGTLLWMGVGFIPGYYGIILLASALLPLGILIILTANWNNKAKNDKRDGIPP